MHEVQAGFIDVAGGRIGIVPGCTLFQFTLARERDGLFDTDLQLCHRLLVEVEGVGWQVHGIQAEHGIGQCTGLGRDGRQRLGTRLHAGQPGVAFDRECDRGLQGQCFRSRIPCRRMRVTGRYRQQQDNGGGHQPATQRHPAGGL